MMAVIRTRKRERKEYELEATEMRPWLTRHELYNLCLCLEAANANGQSRGDDCSGCTSAKYPRLRIADINERLWDLKEKK